MRFLNLLACLCAAAASAAQAAEPQAAGQAIPGFGNTTPVANAANLPDRSIRYRVIFSVAKAAQTPAKVNPSLDKVARFLNLLGSEGIRPARNDVVVILHGAAAAAVLGDEAYRARYGVDNPNLPLIRALRRAGATIHVCGQALVSQKIDRSAVSADVITDLSALTTIATLQLKGWVLMPE